MPTTGAATVWDESYNGTRPEKVMYVRLTDFAAPGPLTDIVAARPEANGPVTFTWVNPPDADLGGIRIVRLTTGKATLVGLRRGLIPMNADGEWMYDQEEDIILVEADTTTGVVPTQYVDETAPAGTVYYTFVPFDNDLHHLYPIPDEAVVQVDSVIVSADQGGRPTSLRLDEPTPNPAASSASISYAVAEAGNVRIAMYDVSGRCVATLLDANVDAGTGIVQWDLSDAHGARVGNGVYVCRMEQGTRNVARHVVVVR
jgi:hypothetical protein